MRCLLTAHAAVVVPLCLHQHPANLLYQNVSMLLSRANIPPTAILEEKGKIGEYVREEREGENGHVISDQRSR